MGVTAENTTDRSVMSNEITAPEYHAHLRFLDGEPSLEVGSPTLPGLPV